VQCLMRRLVSCESGPSCAMVMIIVCMGVFVSELVDMGVGVIVIRDGTAAIFAHNKVLKKYI
jgi:hypothetical protein